MDSGAEETRRSLRIPLWVRPPAITALVLMSITTVRFCLSTGGSVGLAEFGSMVARVGAAGAAGALLPTLLFRLVRKHARSASLMTGVIGCYSYLLACSYAFGQVSRDVRSVAFWVVGAGFGMLIGWRIILPLALCRGRSVEPTDDAR